MLLSEISQHHETEKFKTWFGRSKIVDDEGKPLVVYHATATDFEAFKAGGVDPKISGHAIWLTTNKTDQPAKHNIHSRVTKYREGTNVLPLYVRMERPLEIDTKEMLEWARDVFANGSEEFPQLMPKAWKDEVTKDGEYDGIIFDGEKLWGDSSHVEIIVFNPKQIKSAIGNNGSYNVDDDRLTS
jgi:hypothetical protein